MPHLHFNPPGALFPTLPLFFPPVQSNTQDACVADVHMYGFVPFFFFKKVTFYLLPEKGRKQIVWRK